jgi:GNAT superfamily N-acetyltransferase
MIEEVEISEFDRSDLQGVLACLKQVWTITEIREDVLKNFLQNGNFLFVAKIGNRVVGCATLHIQQKLIRDGGIAAFLEEVNVDSSFRGKGIGEKLVKHLVEEAKNRGCYKVTLSCFPERLDFYERCGFVQENITMRKSF